MKDADPPPLSAQAADPTPRKPWSTPTVILSTVSDATGGFLLTQSAGPADHHLPSGGSTTAHS
jgi:hypothetical protein